MRTTVEYRADLERTYRHSHPSMKALLAMMDLSRRWVISDRDPIRHWSRGRVTLVGDAAHPTLQTLAQGACMAMEDAVCLAELIEQANGDFAAREIWSRRGEDEMFDCLAWLYDGFALPPRREAA